MLYSVCLAAYEDTSNAAVVDIKTYCANQYTTPFLLFSFYRTFNPPGRRPFNVPGPAVPNAQYLLAQTQSDLFVLETYLIQCISHGEQQTLTLNFGTGNGMPHIPL